MANNFTSLVSNALSVPEPAPVAYAGLGGAMQMRKSNFGARSSVVMKAKKSDEDID